MRCCLYRFIHFQDQIISGQFVPLRHVRVQVLAKGHWTWKQTETRLRKLYELQNYNSEAQTWGPEKKKYFIEDTILLEMGPPFYKAIRITRGSGGLPADSCPVLSIWIARRGQNSRSVIRERVGWWEREKQKGMSGLRTCQGCRAKTAFSFLSYFKTLSNWSDSGNQTHWAIAIDWVSAFVGLLTEVMYMEIIAKFVHLLQQSLQINSSMACKVIF